MTELRYIRTGGEVSRLKPNGYGSKLYIKTRRPPREVVQCMGDLSDPVEVYFDTKTKTARLVPFWECLVTW